MNYSFPKLLETLVEGPERRLVLATIVEAEGSTPQVVGASAIFSETGLEAGTVGGGILESRVESIAREALQDGKARLVTFRLDANHSDMEGAICGGAARVLVDPGVGRGRAVFEKALKEIRRGGVGFLVAGMDPLEADRVAVKRSWLPYEEVFALKGADRPPVPLGFSDSEKDLRDPDLRKWGRYVFAELVVPLPRLIIAGAGHVGRAVARLGRLLDFSVTVIDDRPEFADKDRVPEADEIVVGDIEKSVRHVAESEDNYFVIVTRGHRKDGEALRAALKRPAAYVGMIGSKTKVETMRREFLRAGWATEKEWAGICTPIGLDIGSKTVEEIAVSIAAQLILVRSGRKSAWPL